MYMCFFRLSLSQIYPCFKGSPENPKWNSISRNGIKIRNGTRFSFRYIKMSRFTLSCHVQLYQRAQQYRLNLLYGFTNHTIDSTCNCWALWYNWTWRLNVKRDILMYRKENAVPFRILIPFREMEFHFGFFVQSFTSILKQMEKKYLHFNPVWIIPNLNSNKIKVNPDQRARSNYNLRKHITV